MIYGAGVKGISLNRLLKNKSEYLLGVKGTVLYFCDSYKKPGTYIDGIEVICLDQLKQLENKVDRIVISSIQYADEIQRRLIDAKIETDVYVIPEYVFQFAWNEEDMPFYIKFDLNKPRLPYLEIKIVEHCNLKCKGCSALANIKEPKNMEISQFESSLKRLKELFWGIKDLKLFGGEPLLHPELEQFVRTARKYFPDSRIVIHSNGLLIPKMEKSLFDLMKEKDVTFEFTQYPPTGLIKRKIIKVLEECGIEYKFRDALYEFQKVINVDGDYDAEEVYKTCCNCINLIEGTLSCGVGWLVKGLEEKYNTVICEDKFQNSIDLFHTQLDGWKIVDILHSPFHLCKYCAFMNRNDMDKRMMKWECGGPFALSDWIYTAKEGESYYE